MSEVLPDLLDHGLILVFCGTAASEVSARQGAYYANPSNAFWRTLHAIGLTPRLYEPGEFRDLLELRIGFTDLAKFAVGSDRRLVRADFDIEALREKISLYRPKLLAFTSKTAWRVWSGLGARHAVAYGRQAESWGATQVYVLPSPSGAARAFWEPSPWQELADAYQDLKRALV